jgi:hypothetical protein
MPEAQAQLAQARDGDRPLLRFPLEARTEPRESGRWRASGIVGLVEMVLAWRDPSHRLIWVAAAAFSFGLAGFSSWRHWAPASWLLGRLRESSVAAAAWIVIDDDDLARVRLAGKGEPKGRTSLARWSQPFGVSVLANAARSRVLLAFTTPVATRFLGVRVETPRDADAARELLERSITVPDVDLELAAGPSPDALLRADSASTLVRELERRDALAFQRLYLSDARGASIVADPDRLVVGEHVFDLSSPLEWRVFTFQEGNAGVATLYQATTIRQGATETVLVCRAPAEVASWSLGRPSDAAPARETRVAIDRIFMTPLRSILERAPRITRPGPPSSTTRGRAIQT